MTTDVLVVGAGPVGLAAALALDGLGYGVTLAAPSATPSDERTSALLAGSVALLERVGVWQHAGSAAAPLRTLRIVDGTRRLIRAPEVTFHASEIGLDAFGYNLPNTALADALREAVAASGVTLVGERVEDVAASGEEIVARLAGGTEISARLVVAADGRHSRVRDSAGIAATAWRYDQSALVANLRHTQPHDDTSTEFHAEAGPFTLVPLPGQRSSMVWVGRPAEMERLAALPDDDLAASIGERSAAILGDVAIDGRRQVFALAGMNARRMVAERIALVGEAAHLFPPIGAQGLNLGYRDVAALADLLAGRRGDPGSAERLASYERMRRADVLTRTAAVDGVNRSLLSNFLPVQGARSLALMLLDRVGPLRRAVMRQGAALTH